MATQDVRKWNYSYESAMVELDEIFDMFYGNSGILGEDIQYFMTTDEICYLLMWRARHNDFDLSDYPNFVAYCENHEIN